VISRAPSENGGIRRGGGKAAASGKVEQRSAERQDKGSAEEARDFRRTSGSRVKIGSAIGKLFADPVSRNCLPLRSNAQEIIPARARAID